MTVEMSVVGSICLLASTLKSPDGEAMRRHGFFYGWTPLTWVMFLPIFFCDIILWSRLDCCCAHACKKNPINHHIGVENEKCNLCAKHMHVHVNLDQCVFRIQLL
jgi:hypothetical protein